MTASIEVIRSLTTPDILRELHTVSDSDRGRQSQHHTLGKQLNQASPGPHTHDGTDSQMFTNLRILGTLADKAGRPYVQAAVTGGAQRVIRAGRITATTDPSANLTIAHGLVDVVGAGIVPVAVLATGGDNTAQIVRTGAIDATNFVLAVRNATGVLQASVSVTVNWLAYG